MYKYGWSYKASQTHNAQHDGNPKGRQPFGQVQLQYPFDSVVSARVYPWTFLQDVPAADAHVSLFERHLGQETCDADAAVCG